MLAILVAFESKANAMRCVFLVYCIVFAIQLDAQDKCKGCDSVEFKLFQVVKDSVCTQIRRHTESLDVRHGRDTAHFNLITDFTFRNKFSKEFAEILIQENSFSNFNRHASFKIDENESKVNFSPWVFHNDDLGFNPLKFYGSLEFSAEINDQ